MNRLPWKAIHMKEDKKVGTTGCGGTTGGRLEISDAADIARYKLRLSAADIEEIRVFEEGLIAAEQDLGTVRFG